MYHKVFENSDLFNIIINLCINNIELQLNNIELKLIYCTKLINNNKTIYGYGAPTKATTLMNFFKIDNIWYMILKSVCNF